MAGLEELYARVHAAVRRYAARRLWRVPQTWADLDDVLQEAWAVAVRSRYDRLPPGVAAVHLMREVRRVIRAARYVGRRGVRRWHPPAASQVPADWRDPPARAGGGAVGVGDYLPPTLTPTEAAVVPLLCAGHTLDEAAALLGRHRNTVLYAWGKALPKIRATLVPGGTA